MKICQLSVGVICKNFIVTDLMLLPDHKKQCFHIPVLISPVYIIITGTLKCDRSPSHQ